MKEKEINWNDIQYDIGIASKDFEKLKIMTQKVVPIKLTSQFDSLRSELLEARDELYEENHFDFSNKLDYKFDLLFGLKLYNILGEEIGFTPRVATNDDIWRYLSVKVIRDIVHSRWQLNEDHFYKISRRIWLKTIWWYIHLSWMGDQKSTYEILKNNTTDTVLQLVERPGIGYNVMVYRELMYQYHKYEDTSRNLFRQILKLNTARLLTTSPELVEGGILAYVDDLFKSIKE